ncbi:peptidyl-prolyl cis-trans isomerase FKBP2 [Salpingoeca rosetta]|uniref:peptidylprolyl isomerase n=1 Tax=Salpingoeca rosetta (strain ATCC 50818 / BSB-021) TaxID=946362 RepID=F2TYT1_SALR5|nr:peptidyl-prolyl cis-trans isomerase FKBP2 [Salpingoeca rosetta]EGD78755.1 peptidyl-prolyl cis-trans isomerase FKBP2 [Salpingoeca rosetta]|eukprot:XP_004997712.1 peptidyl-prolyl cis-trans isomerase FKBP2 [Salpingoeca rosetta]
MMSCARWLVVVVVAVVVAAAVVASSDSHRHDQHSGTGKRLQIGVKHRSEDCHLKSGTGDTLAVHYTGYLADTGDTFDSSLPRGDPLVFTLGDNQVIQGWEQGLLNMCIGEVRSLAVPWTLAYGDYGAPPAIPPRANLRFEVELLHIDKRHTDSHHSTASSKSEL